MRYSEIKKILLSNNDKIKLFDGFDEAIIGYTNNYSVVYDIEKFLLLLVEKGLSNKEACSELNDIMSKNSSIEDPLFISL